MPKLICNICGRDLNEISQCNMSYSLDLVLCEDCSRNYYTDDQRDYYRSQIEKPADKPTD